MSGGRGRGGAWARNYSAKCCDSLARICAIKILQNKFHLVLQTHSWEKKCLVTLFSFEKWTKLFSLDSPWGSGLLIEDNYKSTARWDVSGALPCNADDTALCVPLNLWSYYVWNMHIICTWSIVEPRCAEYWIEFRTGDHLRMTRNLCCSDQEKCN